MQENGEHRSLRGVVRALSALAAFAVIAVAQNTTITFQASTGASITNAKTRSCTIRVASGIGSVNAWTTESTDLPVRDQTGYALIDFPEIVGYAAGRIPPGSQIVSATLELWCNAATGSSATVRTLTAYPVLDDDRLGTWFEPTVAVVQGLEAGVNWLRRDYRPDARVDRPWGVSSSSAPTAADSPALLALYPLSSSAVVDVSSSPQPGSFQVGEFHAFDVTFAVWAWAQGLSNQGWLIKNNTSAEVVYASDDSATSSRRPKLTVTYQTGTSGSPWNHVPSADGTSPAAPSTTEGVAIPITLLAADQDGTTPEAVIIEPPLHGQILGLMPFLTYRPDPSFTGTDSFTWIARDAVATSNPRTTTITVSSVPGTTTKIYQEGVSPPAALSIAETRFCSLKLSAASGNQVTYEDDYVKIADSSSSVIGREGILDFPSLIGSGAEQIPLGSTILAARLEIETESISGTGVIGRIIGLHRVIDPLDRGTSWWEPIASATESAGGVLNGGVTYNFADARPGSLFPWHVPGGDVHTLGTSSFTIDPLDVGEVRKTVDVRQAVQAWASGEPNFGWILRSSSTATVHFWSDDAPIAAKRPKLFVTFRPPSAAILPGTVAPRADAGADQVVLTNQSVMLDASASRHPQGQPFALAWIQTAGPSVVLSDPFSETPWFSAPSTAGVLEFVLAVFTSPTNYTLDTVTIVVNPQPGGTTYGSPLASAGSDFSATEILPVTLIGSAQAQNGGSLSFRWTKLSGPAINLVGATTLNPSFTAPAVGPGGATILFDLAVTESIGATFSTTRHDLLTVTILNAVNLPPIVAPGPNRTVEAGDWVVMDGTASSDPQGQSMTFAWSQISGPTVNLGLYETQGTAAAAVTPFLAPDPGGAPGSSQNIVLRLTVSDGELTAFANVTITVVRPLTSFSGSLTSNPMGAYRDQLTRREAQHLLRRIGSGWGPSATQSVRSAGRAATINALIAMSAVPPPSVFDEAFNYAEDIAGASNANPAYNQSIDPYPQFSVAQVEAFWTVHLLRAPNTLHERMVNYWNDRLAVNGRGLDVGKRHWLLMHRAMLDVDAMGDYRDLLRAYVRDPLTLSFIDGFDSVAASPNENFAREFMELHTLGILDENGVPIFSDAEVREGARAFTGFQTGCWAAGGTTTPSCYPSYVSFFHDSGTKTLLGQSGNFDDQDMVDVVLAHDAGDNAARYLAAGLLRTFVCAEPPTATVTALRDVILAQNWNLSAILSTLLGSRAMFAPEARKSIVKSPAELANGLVRTLGISIQTRDIAVTSGTGILGQLRLLNHRLGNPDEVDGWPEDLAWIDQFTAARRFELARRILLLAENPTTPLAGPGGDYPGIPAVVADLSAFLPPPKARFAAECVGEIAKHFDFDLQPQPAAGATTSEFALAVQYLNTFASSSSSASGYVAIPQVFNADQPGQESKLWGLIMLLCAHPEINRL